MTYSGQILLIFGGKFSFDDVNDERDYGANPCAQGAALGEFGCLEISGKWLIKTTGIVNSIINR